MLFDCVGHVCLFNARRAATRRMHNNVILASKDTRRAATRVAPPHASHRDAQICCAIILTCPIPSRFTRRAATWSAYAFGRRMLLRYAPVEYPRILFSMCHSSCSPSILGCPLSLTRPIVAASLSRFRLRRHGGECWMHAALLHSAVNWCERKALRFNVHGATLKIETAASRRRLLILFHAISARRHLIHIMR